MSQLKMILLTAQINSPLIIMPTGNLEEMTKGWMIATSTLLITFFVTVSKKEVDSASVCFRILRGF
ncbi:hypothetical protein [Vibrio vulnificus]|uniref:hypothetical protein n=1 Tax=Vibrio vulnificus TaxID=672 RepID=UPI000DAB4C57|nr:hypothetical protein [Vibrio vulnificus]RAH19110.1 hypothetical protein DOT36_19050 [Vibrio vulnificus]